MRDRARMPRATGTGLLAATVLVSACAEIRAPRPPAAATCVPPARWMTPASGRERDTPDVLEDAARSRVVLLGEQHDRTDDHRWQLQTVAGLAARRSRLVIGFEMFPRRVQPVLDRWVAGQIDADTLLRDTDWARVWGFPAEPYLPLFELARLNRFPMRALNVDRTLVARVGREGWSAVPAAEREGLSDPAPAPAAYAAALDEVLGAHGGPVDDGARRRFIDAQLTWDRAFAEGLAEAARTHPDALVIGIVGSGHLEHRHGVPHQLVALGHRDVTVLLPWDTAGGCGTPARDLADAVFGIPPAPPVAAGERPRLGVTLAPAPAGARVAGVAAGSVGQAAGLRPGDVVLEAAGSRVRTPDDLRRIIAAQAPGTWLPLRVRRGGRERQVVARFGRPS